MALNIRNPEVERLAGELASLTGETKTDAVYHALQMRMEIVLRQKRRRNLSKRLDEIARHCASFPVLDSRTAEEMLYDEHGLPS